MLLRFNFPFMLTMLFTRKKSSVTRLLNFLSTWTLSEKSRSNINCTFMGNITEEMKSIEKFKMFFEIELKSVKYFFLGQILCFRIKCVIVT